MSNQLPGELVYCVHKLSSKFNEVIIIPLSDVHYGNPMFSAHHLQRAIDFILSKPNHYTLLNGDLCECVLKSSKGDVYSQEFNSQAQRDFIIDAFMPLAKAGRILALCQGNHEERIYREAGIDICSDMAKAWGC
jgi:predicted MPP superfamily phosphohydrolase